MRSTEVAPFGRVMARRRRIFMLHGASARHAGIVTCSVRVCVCVCAGEMMHARRAALCRCWRSDVRAIEGGAHAYTAVQL